MTEKEKLARIDELSRSIVAEGETSKRCGDTYQATMTLFNVACSAGDKVSQDAHRLTMHTMLDSILDAGAAIAVYQKEMEQLSGIPFSLFLGRR